MYAARENSRVVVPRIIRTGPMTMPQGPNMAIPANYREQHECGSQPRVAGHEDRPREVVAVNLVSCPRPQLPVGRIVHISMPSIPFCDTTNRSATTLVSV